MERLGYPDHDFDTDPAGVVRMASRALVLLGQGLLVDLSADG